MSRCTDELPSLSHRESARVRVGLPLRVPRGFISLEPRWPTCQRNLNLKCAGDSELLDFSFKVATKLAAASGCQWQRPGPRPMVAAQGAPTGKCHGGVGRPRAQCHTGPCFSTTRIGMLPWATMIRTHVSGQRHPALYQVPPACALL
jgi:hypothetical protein